MYNSNFSYGCTCIAVTKSEIRGVPLTHSTCTCSDYCTYVVNIVRHLPGRLVEVAHTCKVIEARELLKMMKLDHGGQSLVATSATLALCPGHVRGWRKAVLN